MSTDTIQEIELNIKEAKQVVETGKALERLRNNRDFKRLIADEYLHKEAVRLVHLKADINSQSAFSQESIIKQMDCIGSLTHFFQRIEHQAMLAGIAITNDEEEIDGIRTGEIQ